LEPIHIDPALLHAAIPDDSLAGVRLYDATKNAQGQPTPTWIGVALSSFGIIYNPQLYQTLDLAPPAAWADLTDPKLFGFVSLADPAHSGSASVAYMMVLQRAMADGEQTLLAQHPDLAKLPRSDLKKRPEYIRAISDGWHRGMGQLLLIAANSRYFTDSAEIVPTDVARGEAAAGMAIDFYARVTVGTVGPERAAFVSPHAATAITPDPVAILHGVSGKRLKIAMHFVEFLLTPEGQRLWILQPGQPDGPAERSLRRMPIRKDIYSNQTGWADHFDPFTEAGGFNQRGEWMALMGDTLPVWEAAWIDSRDALIDAYGRILHVSDPTLRSKLLRELADVPVTMQDIEQRRAERLQMEKTHADVFDWLARDRIAWGNRFRAHYRSVVSQIRSGA
jgi:ABC-type Fe3+ transport system substrate-binding protein